MQFLEQMKSSVFWWEGGSYLKNEEVEGGRQIKLAVLAIKGVHELKEGRNNDL